MLTVVKWQLWMDTNCRTRHCNGRFIRDEVLSIPMGRMVVGCWWHKLTQLKRLHGVFRTNQFDGLKLEESLTTERNIFPHIRNVMRIDIIVRTTKILWSSHLYIKFEICWKQECIPVGCVPSTAVAVWWGCVCLRRCVCPGALAGGGCLPRRGCLPRGCTLPYGQHSLHALVKTLPFWNFVCGR